MNKKISNLIIRTLSGIVYVALLILSVYFDWVAYLLCIFFIITALFEYCDLVEKNIPDFKHLLSFSIAAAICLFCILGHGCSISPYLIILPACMFILSILMPPLIEKKDKPIERLGLSLLSQFWIVIPLIILFIVWIPKEPVRVLSFFILIWASDTFAYLGGSLFGKHKLAERVSPGKTWEGVIIGSAMTIALAIALCHIPYFNRAGMTILQWVVFALLIEVFGLLGDLTESLLKREVGVKDSGKIMPGHGGVLDRLDSILLATVPAFLFSMYC